MAQWQAYTWIGLAAASPLACAVLCWCLALCRTYRKHWRSLDLLLVALLSTQVLRSLLLSAWAILRLARPDNALPCKAAIGAMTAATALQLTVLASLVVDRALTVKWPYRYVVQQYQHSFISFRPVRLVFPQRFF